MISHVRVMADGKSAGEVEAELYRFGDWVRDFLGVDVSFGECHIQRMLEAPEGTDFAFQGRLVLHPDISSVEGDPTSLDEDA